jgi:PEP-CTERM motif
MCRRRRVLTIMTAVAILLASATASYATAYSFDVMVDLSAVPIENVVVGGDPGNRIRFDADFPDIDEFFVTDTLHVNVSFANGGLLTLTDSGAAFLGDNERILVRSIVQGTFRASDRHDVYQFTGVQGSLLINPLVTDSFTNDLNLTDTAFSASGFTLDLTFSNPVFDPDLPIFAALVGTSFELWADTITVQGDAAAVPEPSTFALLGLGLAAWARRRK